MSGAALREWQGTARKASGSQGTHFLVCCKDFLATSEPRYFWSTCVRLPWWLRTSLVVQMVKHLPTMWETWLQSLGLENLLEKEMATHSSSLA